MVSQHVACTIYKKTWFSWSNLWTVAAMSSPLLEANFGTPNRRSYPLAEMITGNLSIFSIPVIVGSNFKSQWTTLDLTLTVMSCIFFLILKHSQKEAFDVIDEFRIDLLLKLQDCVSKILHLPLKCVSTKIHCKLFNYRKLLKIIFQFNENEEWS